MSEMLLSKISCQMILSSSVHRTEFETTIINLQKAVKFHHWMQPKDTKK